MFSMTEKAKEAIKKIYKEETKKRLMRIYFAGIGWGGPRLNMVLDEPTNKDTIIKTDGIKIAMSEHDKVFAESFGQIRIEYMQFSAKGTFLVYFDGSPSRC